MSDQNMRRRERFQAKSAYVASKYLRRMKELSGLPASLAPFTEILQKVHVEFARVCPEDKKAVGTYCVMVPQELIYAAGAVPLKLCSGSFTAFSIGEDTTPRDACPLVKAVAGMQEIGMLSPYADCEAMIVPITCDCKKKMAAMLADQIPVHVMQVPSVRQSDELLELYVEELYRLIPVLEGITGNTITFASLQHAADTVGAAQAELQRFQNLQRKASCTILRGTHRMAVMNAFSFMPIDAWTASLHSLNEELEVRCRESFSITRKRMPRLLLTGSPVTFPNLKIPLLIEETGGVLVADETCMGDRFLYDPLAVWDQSFDGYMRALATRSIRPCTCPTFLDSSTRLYRLKQMIRENKVDGIVYHVLRGCLVYDFEYALLEEEMEKLGIPIIRVETDYQEEDVEQLRIRIEAFVELIKLKDTAKGN